MTFNLNYSTKNNIEKELNVSNAPDFIKPEAEEVKMVVTSFGINIYGKCDLQVYEEANWSAQTELTDDHCYEKLDLYDSKIIMNDSTEYYLYRYEGSDEGAGEGENVGYYEENIVLSYSYAPGAPTEPEINLIDTREVKSVIINGDTVYSN